MTKADLVKLLEPLPDDTVIWHYSNEYDEYWNSQWFGPQSVVCLSDGTPLPADSNRPSVKKITNAPVTIWAFR